MFEMYSAHRYNVIAHFRTISSKVCDKTTCY